jgi:hypothetical protein
VSHVLERRQVVPGGLDQVFAFFEDPRNLEAISPLGRLVHGTVVRPQLEAIFDYRRDVVSRLFIPRRRPLLRRAP